MSTDERVRVRLHDNTAHTGRIVAAARPRGRARRHDARRRARHRRAACTSPTSPRSAPPPRPARRDRRDPRLAACAHAFGYRGHCLTKSRRYSTTFKALREAREAYVHEQILARSPTRPNARSPSERREAHRGLRIRRRRPRNSCRRASCRSRAAARAREERSTARWRGRWSSRREARGERDGHDESRLRGEPRRRWRRSSRATRAGCGSWRSCWRRTCRSRRRRRSRIGGCARARRRSTRARRGRAAQGDGGARDPLRAGLPGGKAWFKRADIDAWRRGERPVAGEAGGMSGR